MNNATKAMLLLFIILAVMVGVLALHPIEVTASAPLGITLTPTAVEPTPTQVTPTNPPPTALPTSTAETPPTATPTEPILPPVMTATPTRAAGGVEKERAQRPTKTPAAAVLPGTGELPPGGPGGTGLYLLITAVFLAGLAAGLLFRKSWKGVLPFVFLAAGVILVTRTASVDLGGITGTSENAVQAAPLSYQTEFKTDQAPLEGAQKDETVQRMLPAATTVTNAAAPLRVPVDAPPAQRAGVAESLDSSPVQRVIIPALAVDARVMSMPRSGDSWDLNGLRDNVGWLEGTSLPGLGGNTVLAGHIMVLYIGAGPFRYLHHLKPGDEILVDTLQKRYSFLVTDQFTVAETDVQILADTDEPQLTLFTCSNWDPENEHYWKRRVVTARLNEVQNLAEGGPVIGS
jgi:LPXTG-site transpeptidase (sortase) family protein